MVLVKKTLQKQGILFKKIVDVTYLRDTRNRNPLAQQDGSSPLRRDSTDRTQSPSPF